MRSPISTHVAIVATETMRGMMELSAMRNRLMPLTAAFPARCRKPLPRPLLLKRFWPAVRFPRQRQRSW